MQMKVYSIGLTREDSNPPNWYYNKVTKAWIDGFQMGCAFSSKEEAQETLDELCLFGAQIDEGIMDIQ